MILKKVEDAIEFHDENSNSFKNKYNTNSDFIQRYKIWSFLFSKYLKPEQRVLDVGCGSGIFSLLALNSYNCYVTGIDASSKMIELCLEQVSENNKNRLNFILGNVPFDLPIDVGSFDIVFSSSVLEYIENVDETILKIKNLLVERNGLFILSVPNGSSYYRRLERSIFYFVKFPKYYKHVKNVYNRKSFIRYICSFGFEFLELEYYANTNAVSRILKRILPKQYVSNLMVGVFKVK